MLLFQASEDLYTGLHKEAKNNNDLSCQNPKETKHDAGNTRTYILDGDAPGSIQAPIEISLICM